MQLVRCMLGLQDVPDHSQAPYILQACGRAAICLQRGVTGIVRACRLCGSTHDNLSSVQQGHLRSAGHACSDWVSDPSSILQRLQGSAHRVDLHWACETPLALQWSCCSTACSVPVEAKLRCLFCLSRAALTTKPGGPNAAKHAFPAHLTLAWAVLSRSQSSSPGTGQPQHCCVASHVRTASHNPLSSSGAGSQSEPLPRCLAAPALLTQSDSPTVEVDMVHAALLTASGRR